MFKIKISTLLSVIFTIIFVSPTYAALVGDTSKATLSISPQSGSFNVNDTFKLNIYVNTNNQNINAVTAHLNYDKTHFQAVSIDTTGSVFNMIAETKIDSSGGKIRITVGIPAPGNVNTSSGLVAAVTFKAIANVTPASDNFTFDFAPGDDTRSSVYLDDKKGTDFLSGVYGGRYQVGEGGPVTYSDGTLLRASNSDKIYLIENNQKRWIPSGDIFQANGYSWLSVIVVDPSVISQYPEGSNVTASSIQTPSIPEGGLIRAAGDIDVYIVKYVGAKKFKRLILSPSVFNSYQHLKWSDIKDVDKSVIDSFTTSDLVRAVNDPKVYKLYPSGDTGEKRWITTADAFFRMGFDWDAIYEINQVDRDSYIEGNTFE